MTKPIWSSIQQHLIGDPFIKIFYVYILQPTIQRICKWARRGGGGGGVLSDILSQLLTLEYTVA